MGNRRGVHRSIGSVVKKYEAVKHEEPMDEAKFLKEPCVGDTRVEYMSASLIDLPHV